MLAMCDICRLKCACLLLLCKPISLMCSNSTIMDMGGVMYVKAVKVIPREYLNILWYVMYIWLAEMLHDLCM
jgi:hypothetical protein